MTTEAERAAEEWVNKNANNFEGYADENDPDYERPKVRECGYAAFLAGHAHALRPRKNQYWLILFQSHEKAGADPHWLVDTEDYAKEICKNNNGNLSATASFAPWTYIPIELLPPTPQEG